MAKKTFAEIAESLLSMALNEGTSSDRTDVIFDDYRDDSRKSAERENRGEGSGSEFRNLQQITRSNNGENSCAVHGTSRL